MRLPQAKKQGISHPKTHTKFGDRKRATVKKQPPKRGLIQVVCYPTSPETVDITGFFEKFCIAIRTKSKKPPDRAASCAFCGKRESDPQGASVSPKLRWSFRQRAVRRRPNGEPRKQPASERKEESASRR